MEPTTAAAAQFGHLFSSWRHHPATAVDALAGPAAAYRYNHNMMEYYTCKTSKSSVPTMVGA